MPKRLNRHVFLGFGLALIIGTAGGFLFHALRVPLAWMLGAMTASSIAAIAGAPVAAPAAARIPMTALIGVILGSSVRPDLFDHLNEWVFPLLMLPVFLAAGAAASVAYFVRVGGLDLKTAYFAGMPGGLVEMVLMAEANKADAHTVSLVHALRVLLVIMILPFAIRLFTGAPVSSTMPVAAGTPDMTDLLWVLLCVVGGSAVGILLRLPIRFFLGPLLFSAVLHATGVTDFNLPGWTAGAAQVVLGTVIGCRFRGVAPAEVLRIGIMSLGAVVILLAITALFAGIVGRISGYGFTAMLLAYSPGGLAEMSLIAYTLKIETMFVFGMHLLRVLIVAFGAALVLPRVRRFAERRRGPGGG
ncbi:AbrB family transcriptional regulator [Paracoccus pacificus]|uniref:AbrB family transcriptional regulator n=1 Tax=Paracoccus pacificus TaxID=1463598 RepID=A0ABW4R4F9_9RHOB